MYRRNFPNDPGFADSIAVAARLQQRQAQQNESRGVTAVRCLVCCGLLLAGCILAFWNEAQAVARDRVLYEGLERVTSLPAAEYHSASNEDRLVHISGKLDISGWCLDPEFGVRLRAYRMRRTVEMYQWREELENNEVTQPDGSSRSESVPIYSAAWEPRLIDSRLFLESRSHQNPRAMPHAEMSFTADSASLGAYQLTGVFLDQLVPDTQVEKPPSDEVPIEELARRGYQWLGGHLYVRGADPRKPQIGDARLTWSYAGLAGDVFTVIGRQSQDRLTAYPVPNGEIDSIALLAKGYQSPRRMFARELAKSKLKLWLIRCLAWLLMLVAYFALRPRLADSIIWRCCPPLRPLLSLPSFTIGLCLSGCLSIGVTGLAWLRHRPAMGLGLLAVCCAPAALIRLRPLLTAATARLRTRTATAPI